VNPVQTPQKNVRVEIAGTSATRGYFLPFLGEVSKVEGVAGNGKVTFTLPEIEKGAVFWGNVEKQTALTTKDSKVHEGKADRSSGN
jgi:hypothetical protein